MSRRCKQRDFRSLAIAAAHLTFLLSRAGRSVTFTGTVIIYLHTTQWSINNNNVKHTTTEIPVLFFGRLLMWACSEKVWKPHRIYPVNIETDTQRLKWTTQTTRQEFEKVRQRASFGMTNRYT